MSRSELLWVIDPQFLTSQSSSFYKKTQQIYSLVSTVQLCRAFISFFIYQEAHSCPTVALYVQSGCIFYLKADDHIDNASISGGEFCFWIKRK